MSAMRVRPARSAEAAILAEMANDLNDHVGVTCYGLLAMGIGAGMLMNAPLSALAHASYNRERGALLDLMQQGGLKAFLEARDGAFRPEPFGPKSTPKTS